MATADKGIYVDTKSGKVVRSQPEEGVQLVAPGEEIPADGPVAALIDAGSYEKAADVSAVETATVTTTPKKAAGK